MRLLASSPIGRVLAIAGFSACGSPRTRILVTPSAALAVVCLVIAHADAQAETRTIQCTDGSTWVGTWPPKAPLRPACKAAVEGERQPDSETRHGKSATSSSCKTIFDSGILVRMPDAELERFALVNRTIWEGLGYDTRLNVAEAIRQCTKVRVREIKDGRSGLVLAKRSYLGEWSLR